MRTYDRIHHELSDAPFLPSLLPIWPSQSISICGEDVELEKVS